MSRMRKDGLKLPVRTQGELPAALRWNGVWHPVERIALRWHLDRKRWGPRTHRNYFKLLAAGMALVVYHDLLTDSWALQRVYD